MSKKISSLIFAYLLFINPLFGDIHTATVLKDDPNNKTISEDLVVPFSQAEFDQKWKLAYKEVTPGGAWIIEWIPTSENINSWSQLIQIQYFPYSQISQANKINAEDFSNIFVKTLKEQFPGIQSNITKKTADNVFIEWSLPQATKGESPQNEVAEVISTDKGLYRIAFTKKVPTMESDLKKSWADRLSQAKIESLQQPVAK